MQGLTIGVEKRLAARQVIWVKPILMLRYEMLLVCTDSAKVEERKGFAVSLPLTARLANSAFS